MSRGLVQTPDLNESKHLTLVIGLSCRNLRGFLFMWIHIIEFIRSTQKAEGCLQVLPGVSGPFSILLISYWRQAEDMQSFVRSKNHIKWMQFIGRYPNSLNLFNETYERPVRANFINQPKGYAGAQQRLKGEE